MAFRWARAYGPGWAAAGLSRSAGVAEPYGLGVAELADTVLGQFPPVPGVLHATEGQLGVRRGHPVDEDQAGVEVAAEPLLLLGIVRPRVGPQPVPGAVGERDGLLVRGDPVQPGDRTEDLFGPHPHRRVE